MKKINFRNLGLFVFCIISSVPVAVVVISFRWLLQKADVLRTMMLSLNLPFFVHIGIVLLMWIIAILTLKIAKRYPLTMGSGIPQTSEISVGRLKVLSPIKDLLTKFLGGLMSISIGFSLSRGGPAVEMGSFIGKIMSKISRMRDIEARYLQVATGSAGLSAAFTTPLSATIFTLEGITHQMSIKNVVATLLASGTAGWITMIVYPNNPYKVIDITSPHGLTFISSVIIMFCFALIIAILGKFFNLILILCQKRYIQNKLSPKIKLLFVVTLIYLVGLWIPTLIGDGELFLLLQGTSSIGIKLLLTLILVKIILTSICYSPGLPGGIFLPLLVIGGLSGKLFGMTLAELGYIDTSIHYGYFMILGMAGFFVATVRTPITGIVFTIELTQQFGAFFPAIIFVSATFFLSQVISTKPIYNTLYDELIEPTVKKGSMVSVDFAINQNSFLIGKTVSAIPLPQGCTVTAIKRHGNTVNFQMILELEDVITIKIPSDSLEQLFPVFNALVKEN